MPLRAASIAAAVGLLALVVAIAVVGAQKGRRPLGTNGIRPLAFVAEVGPHETLCQAKETVPKGTGGVWMRIGTYGAPTPRLTVAVEGKKGSLAPGWAEGDVVIPVARVPAERTGARLCLTNGGDAKLAIAGEYWPPELNATIGAAKQPGRIRIEWDPPTERSWWATVPAVAERMNIVRNALPGIAALPIYVLLAALVAGGAVALVLREARE